MGTTYTCEAPPTQPLHNHAGGTVDVKECKLVICLVRSSVANYANGDAIISNN